MVELPTGTVTFLFTDVEGSTRLLKQLRERYAEVLSDHHRILRDAFAEAGGHEIDTQGDSFFVAFRKAKDAVAAAVAAQRALAEHAWPDGAELRVRMGIHTGEATVADDRYLGVAVHRAARICAAGHGGQILVSQLTHDLLHDEETELPGVGMRDLGEQRLKDLDRPLRLYQVDVPGLRSEFPPLRTAETAPERGMTPFAGQEGDLAVAAREAVLAKPRLSRRAWIALASAVAVVALAGFVALAAARDGDAPPPPIRPGSLVKLDPESGEVLDVFSIARHGGLIRIVGDNVWVHNWDERTVTRLNARTGALDTIGIETAAGGITGADDGRVWVSAAKPSRLVLVNAVTMQVNRTIRVDAPAIGPLASGAGDLWVVVPAPGASPVEGEAMVWRIDPKSGKVEARKRVGITAWATDYGADALWVINYRDDRVVRIDPLDGSVVARDVRAGPLQVTVGAGAVWVSHFADSTLVRLHPHTMDMDDVIRLPEPAGGVAVSGESVWVSQPKARSLVRFDAADGAKRQTIRLQTTGGWPFGVAVGADALWVTVGPPEE